VYVCLYVCGWTADGPYNRVIVHAMSARPEIMTGCALGPVYEPRREYDASDADAADTNDTSGGRSGRIGSVVLQPLKHILYYRMRAADTGDNFDSVLEECQAALLERVAAHCGLAPADLVTVVLKLEDSLFAMHDHRVAQGSIIAEMEGECRATLGLNHLPVKRRRRSSKKETGGDYDLEGDACSDNGDGDCAAAGTVGNDGGQRTEPDHHHHQQQQQRYRAQCDVLLPLLRELGQTGVLEELDVDTDTAAATSTITADASGNTVVINATATAAAVGRSLHTAAAPYVRFAEKITIVKDRSRASRSDILSSSAESNSESGSEN
jgi:hypothetical protein